MILTGSCTAADSNQTNNETVSLFNNSSGSLIIVNPEDSIQDAIQRSSPGDIIEVHGGVHRENINVSKRVAIRGIDEGDGLPVVDAHWNGSAINVTADGVQIEKLIVENSNDSGVKIISNDSIIKSIIVRNNEHYGIELFRSNNNNISGNNLSDNGNGIHLASSDNNSLLKNDIIGRGYGSGIELANSEKNSIVGNNLSGNSDGIRLSSSGSNRLRMNFMSGNNINFYMDGERISDFDNDIDDTNIADGRFVNYIKGVRDEIIDASSDALLIGCFNCTNVTLQNLNSSDGVDSFIVVSTNGSKFIENYLRIRFYFSNNNNISQNEIIDYENGIQRYSFHDNAFVNGILLASSNNNSLLENDIVGSNDGSGIELTNSNNNSLAGNNLSDNFDGIRLASSNNNSLLENHIVSLGDGSGIELTDSQNNNLTGNNLSDNRNGISLASSNNNSLLDNDIVGSYNGYGIDLTNSNNNSLAGNNLSDSRNGISLASSNNNSLLKNDIVGSHDGFGIELTDSQNNNLTGNNLSDSKNSIRLASSNNNSLLKNNIVGRGYGSGIALTNSENNSLIGNNLSGNSDGIRLSSSGGNRLRINHLSKNMNNFYMEGERISDFDNDIDDTNIADGRFVNYIKGSRDEVIDASSDALLIGCFNCTNVTLQNLNSSDGIDSFLVVSTNGSKFIENFLSIRFYFSNNNNISQNKIIGYENGILLHSSHANALIKNYLSDNDIGMQLESSQNNSILENDIVGNDYSIELHDSENNNFTSNNLSDNYYGIYLYSSNTNSLLENDIIGSNEGSGIALTDSENNSLVGNNLNGNNYGINLVSSGSNLLSNNLMSGNEINFDMDGKSISDFDNDIDVTNLAEGRPINYLKGTHDKIINATINELLIGCFNCTNITLQDRNISADYTSIIVANTHFSKFIDNNLSIRFYFSNNNTIGRNRISGDGYGILLYSSDNNSLEANAIQECNLGLSLESSDANALINNYLEDNVNGIRLATSDNNSVLENEIIGKGYGIGIELTDSNYNLIEFNIVKNSIHGIRIISSSNNSFNNNSVSDNITYSIEFDMLNNNEFTNNSEKETEIVQDVQEEMLVDSGEIEETEGRITSPIFSGSSSNNEPSSEREPQLKPQTNTQPDDEDLKKLFGGIISFKPKIPMIVNETTDVIASIAPNNTSASKTIYAVKEKDEELVVKGFTISKWMRLSLQDPGKKFQIEALSHVDQKILGDVPATWRWTMTPKEEGKHRLILVATLLEEKENGEKEVIRDVDVQTEFIDVIANKNETAKASNLAVVSEAGRDISSFVKEAVGLLTAIFGLIIAYRKLRKGDS